MITAKREEEYIRWQQFFREQQRKSDCGTGESPVKQRIARYIGCFSISAILRRVCYRHADDTDRQLRESGTPGQAQNRQIATRWGLFSAYSGVVSDRGTTGTRWWMS